MEFVLLFFYVTGIEKEDILPFPTSFKGFRGFGLH